MGGDTHLHPPFAPPAPDDDHPDARQDQDGEHQGALAGQLGRLIE